MSFRQRFSPLNLPVEHRQQAASEQPASSLRRGLPFHSVLVLVKREVNEISHDDVVLKIIEITLVIDDGEIGAGVIF